MDIITAYQKVGTYRGAADICGTTHKTVKRVVERHAAGETRAVRAPRPANYEAVRALVAQDVKDMRGRISAKRLLPTARAAGYTGSARNFRRLVAQEKKAWRAEHGRTHRPASWSPGEHLVIDWGVIAGVHVFCAVLAWSRFRFVRFAADETAATTMTMLAECFEVLGGTPKVVLADRMGCLKGGVVANRVVPTADYVRFATHYRFRPDFCEAADPESKGVVEALVRYGKDDLARPLLLEHVQGLEGDQQAAAARILADLGGANRRAADWCAEVNAVVHSEIAAVPNERLAKEADLLTELPSLRPVIGPAPATRKVDKMSTIRLGSARYSVPNRLIGTAVGVLVDGTRVLILDPGTGEVHAEHPLVAPGEASVLDEHYGGPRPATPVRAIRPRSAAEKDFCSLGPVAEAFIAGAAGAGHTRLGPELAALNTLTAAHGAAAMVAALERATAFGRWKASDVRSILAAGTGVPTPRPAGDALVLDLPTAAGRSLAEYAPATKAVSS
ncbi:IS21 family transposase [Ornithinimicrobium cerasi]|uniref:IS21 family transposase n=1 Tax=Ornithinimicrobium cerasi TaxID=2248773 RepID=UPI000EFF22ED|nr:IS21 family transposase [Ornithinimicrobium cerasi]